MKYKAEIIQTNTEDRRDIILFREIPLDYVPQIGSELMYHEDDEANDIDESHFFIVKQVVVAIDSPAMLVYVEPKKYFGGWPNNPNHMEFTIHKPVSESDLPNYFDEWHLGTIAAFPPVGLEIHLEFEEHDDQDLEHATYKVEQVGYDPEANLCSAIVSVLIEVWKAGRTPKGCVAVTNYKA